MGGALGRARPGCPAPLAAVRAIWRTAAGRSGMSLAAATQRGRQRTGGHSEDSTTAPRNNTGEGQDRGTPIGLRVLLPDGVYSIAGEAGVGAYPVRRRTAGRRERGMGRLGALTRKVQCWEVGDTRLGWRGPKSGRGNVQLEDRDRMGGSQHEGEPLLPFPTLSVQRVAQESEGRRRAA